MKFNAQKSNMINMYILEKIEQGTESLSASVAEAFDISTNTVHSYLRRLQEQNIIVKEKRGEYKLVTNVISYNLKRSEGHLDSETYAFDNCFEQHIKDLPENVYRIWEYAFSEMINNVVDHSAAESLAIQIEQSYLYTKVFIIDNGVGIFNKIKEHLRNIVDKLQQTSDAIAEIDVINALATVAKENNYCKPVILDFGKRLNIVDGRHPVVEKISKQKFIPNDCVLDGDENRTIILTGPNMAGKSTYMRQIALITLMAQIGSFVPAKEAEIPIADRIWTRIGASDNLISDQSTFMVEMSEMASILNNATENSILILDEIGRGTSTYDGLSIAWAVVEHITKNIKARTLFATHYHELTNLEGVLDGVKNYKVSVKELQGGIVFMRKIMRGGTNRSFGIEVADLAGIDKSVIDRAKQILKNLENSSIIFNQNQNYTQSVAKKDKSEVERIISELDFNNLSPMQAFNVLFDLQEKIKEN